MGSRSMRAVSMWGSRPWWVMMAARREEVVRRGAPGAERARARAEMAGWESKA